MSSNPDKKFTPIRTTWYQNPTIILSIGLFAVSSASLFIRYAQQEMPSLIIAALRLVFASILLSPWILGKHTLELRRITKKEWIRILVAGFLLAIHFAAWISSLEFTSVASSVVLVTTTPIWVAIFSPIILKEHPNQKTIFGLIVAVFGGVIVSLANDCSFMNASFTCAFMNNYSQPTAYFGNILAVVGAICAAFYLIIGRVLRKTIHLSVYVYCVYSCAAIFLGLFAIIAGKAFFPYSIQSYLFCVALAVFPQIIGHTSLNWAMAYIPVGLVAIVLLGEPIGSTILAVIFLREIPTIFEILGGMVILFGIILASSSRTEKV